MPRKRRGKRGQGRVFKRDRMWWLAFHLADGTRWRESARTNDKKEAEKLLRQRLAERDQGALPDRGATPTAEGEPDLPSDEAVAAAVPTFEKARDVFYADMRMKRCRTFEDARRRVEKHLARGFAGRELASITASEIRQFQAMRLDEGAQTGGIRREMAALKRMFRLALQDGLIAAMPHIPMPAEGTVNGHPKFPTSGN